MTRVLRRGAGAERTIRRAPSPRNEADPDPSTRLRFFFSSRRRHTRCSRDWSSDVCSSDLGGPMKTARLSRPLAVIVVLAAAGASNAQDVPRMANGKPDFSGIYTPPSTVNATGPRGNLIFNADKMAPVKPGAEGLLYEPRNGDPRHDEPRAMCLPAGFPSGMLYILPIQIVQNPKHIVIIPELQRAARIIPTDGRPHREGIEPTYYGDSVGKWEGDTLVIDSVNFKRWILDDYHYTDPTRTRWHSEELHTIERLTRDGNKLRYQITIDDPKIFTEPFSQDFELTLRPDWEPLGLLEYVCEENNRCAGGNCRPSDVQ